MPTPDDFSTYVSELLAGTYDCADRISLRGYYPMGQTSGGILTWWNDLYPGTLPTQQRLRKMAGDFARRVRAFVEKNRIPILYCPIGDKTKHEQAEKLRPADPKFQGVFAVLVSKASALVWNARTNGRGQLVLRRPKAWPLVYHYHFHIMDKDWGHITVTMSGHPPFGIRVTLNGHEWVQCQARDQSIAWVKQDNCFVGGDFAALSRLARELDGPSGLARLAEVCDRWVYSACLCFGLTGEEQKRSGFRYAYSAFQIEYSRNLLFRSGRKMDELYQGLIERTRRLLDVPRLKTIFGRKRRPQAKSKRAGRLEKILDRSVYDLTVFKLHFGKLTLKMYDKSDRVLRTEIIVNNISELKCGKKLEKLPGMLERLQQMVVEFLNVVQAASLSIIGARQLDALSAPTLKGQKRLAGVDLQKPRMRAVAQAVIALAAQPQGFTACQLAKRLREQEGRKMAGYNQRSAAYDLRKLRGKALVKRMESTRRYRVRRPGIRTLAGLLILREKVIKPVLAGLARPKQGRPPKNVHPLDLHYQKLQLEMISTLRILNLAA
jgi:DNA-binding transcriptional ArsR family regulator